MQMYNGILAKNFKNNGVADIHMKPKFAFKKSHWLFKKENRYKERKNLYVQLFQTLKLAFLTSYKLRVNETYSYSSLMHKDSSEYFVYLA